MCAAVQIGFGHRTGNIAGKKSPDQDEDIFPVEKSKLKLFHARLHMFRRERG